MVRVLAIADEEVPTAEQRARQRQFDVVIAAGDLSGGYLQMVGEAVDAPVVYVPGNHDLGDPSGAINVDRTVREVAGLRVVGLGGCVRYNEGPHQYTQQQFADDAAALIDRSRAPVDVLLTHAPPLGLGDASDPAHIGIAALHDLIEALQPTWHLHGHIHPYGMAKPNRRLGDTTICNVIPWTVLEIEARDASQAMS